jgi:hypothetical protein
MLDLGEHRLSLSGSSLPAAKLGQPDKRLASYADSISLELGRGEPQLLLSLLPQAAKHQDAGIVSPANGEQRF